MPYNAFTLKADDGTLRTISTPIGINVSTSIRDKFKKDTNVIEKIAVWDTSTTDTVITERIAKELSLEPVDTIMMNTVNNPREEANIYLVDIVLPNNVYSNKRVSGAK